MLYCTKVNCILHVLIQFSRNMSEEDMSRVSDVWKQQC